eukprot:NODE_2529_length_1096_cov_4.457498_g2101_i0.p3 GENE.NODE_2529_length_1096_cov_4.457498_g2101_i0~~NODE_2529_length_1096_cov_4.457498_g2101_i0.p3  ORF type:complete len:87 (-),score=10.19 NODE_2529_length_1096_cov_4.457498_g2101_i0:124-384(-)
MPLFADGLRTRTPGSVVSPLPVFSLSHLTSRKQTWDLLSTLRKATDHLLRLPFHNSTNVLDQRLASPTVLPPPSNTLPNVRLGLGI